MQKLTNNNSINNGKRELELYIHIPFCVKKCAYCDFLSAAADEKSRFVYMNALKKEIAKKGKSIKQTTVTSVFVGGGTPTVLSGEMLVDLLECVKASFDVDDNAEITFECNPGTADYDKLKRCREAGYNRISIGLQSAQDDELKRLGRIHDYAAFEATYRYAVECGFDNINVDLMSAIPGQTMESIDDSLDRLLALNPKPTHISSYSLILEEGTLFWSMDEAGELELPDEDTERAMHWRIIDRLEQEGYREYELSNLAIPGYECKHNIGYWIRKDYIGLGLGAASLYNGKRQSNTRSMDEYLAYYNNDEGEEEPLSEDIMLTKADETEEFMFLGLRLTEGISTRLFKDIFGADINDIYGEVIRKNIELGLLETADDYLRLTRKGQDLANYVFSQFILE
ncbi:MAG: radical SAM family heme chaperone HemW [Lachnospiraceae bacterium]|nr:radical SAM family heme chaperone HemW [Lachnospiraceae bacterium]